MQSDARGRLWGLPQAVLVLVFVVHAALLGWIGYGNSPVLDEPAHLAAGVWTWSTGRFDVYRVNPPLVRTLAALPVVLSGARTDWRSYSPGELARCEWRLGKAFVRANAGDGRSWHRYFVMARWAVIPISLVGAYFCYRWASDLYGRVSGLVAATLWCSSPNILAWGSTICADAHAAALGVAAGYGFWRWMRRPSWGKAGIAGVGLGLAALTKMTWAILFALWPLLWVMCRRWREGLGGEAPERCGCGGPGEIGTDRGHGQGAIHRLAREGAQIGALLALGLYAINLGYGFEGSFRRLGDYTFASRTLGGEESLVAGGRGGNRFKATWLDGLRIPLPASYVRGMDVQKSEFERGKWSYLCGRWKHGGWWHYYLYAGLLKVPLGSWVLWLLALGVSLAGRSGRKGASNGYWAGWRNETILLVPAVVVFVVVSSQTGFSRYFRYVLPCLPFAFVWVSKVARSVVLGDGLIAWAAGGAVAWSVVSSLCCYPHSMSYFNELAGGPAQGHYYLVDANIDWGQDMWRFARWFENHPEARPVSGVFNTPLGLEAFGLDLEEPPPAPDGTVLYVGRAANRVGPLPGWYAVSVPCIHGRSGRYQYFLRFRPAATAGDSIYIYHITAEDANRVRREMGLPEVGQVEG